MDNEKYIAYCAGLYEGEGCVTSYLHKRRKKDGSYYEYPIIHLKIKMTDIEPLQMFQEFLDVGHITGPYGGENGTKLYWYYSISKISEIQKVMELIYHWLSPRRQKQWEEVYGNYLENVNNFDLNVRTRKSRNI